MKIRSLFDFLFQRAQREAFRRAMTLFPILQAACRNLQPQRRGGLRQPRALAPCAQITSDRGTLSGHPQPIRQRRMFEKTNFLARATACLLRQLFSVLANGRELERLDKMRGSAIDEMAKIDASPFCPSPSFGLHSSVFAIAGRRRPRTRYDSRTSVAARKISAPERRLSRIYGSQISSRRAFPL